MQKFNFEYNTDWLKISLWDLFSWWEYSLLIIWIFIIMILLVVMYQFFPYMYWYTLVRKDEIEAEKKKNLLKELVLYRDIQTQIEKEIEEEFIKALNA